MSLVLLLTVSPPSFVVFISHTPSLTHIMDTPSPQSEGQDQPVVGSPSDFLKNIVGKKVKVRIGNGIDYHGKWHASTSTSSHDHGHLYSN